MDVTLLAFFAVLIIVLILICTVFLRQKSGTFSLIKNFFVIIKIYLSLQLNIFLTFNFVMKQMFC